MGVTMEGSKVTSKTSSLKALLLRAWRERWSDLQWGIHIKTILPRGVSGDVYNLADCILQQALVGPGPNHLVLSYLKHSLSSQLVSYAAVLQRIAKYNGFHKPHCINCLLDFIETIQTGITCRGKPEEGILATAVLGLAHWLLQCFYHAASSTHDSGNDMLQKPAVILQFMLGCNFLTSMLYLGKHDDKDLYNDVVTKCQEIESFLVQSPNIQVPSNFKETLTKLSNLELGNEGFVCGKDKDEDVSEPLTYSVQALLAVIVMRNPSADTTEMTNQLRLLQRIKRYRMSRLCCELMRASLMSLSDALGSSEETRWGAFTFLKLPMILHSLVAPTIPPGGESSDEIVEALQLLLQFTPLVEIMDSPASSNCVEELLNELVKVRLLSEKHVKAYVATRDSMNNNLSRFEIAPGSQAPPISKVIIRAQPTLQRILKTLDADYSKIQDALPSVLCQVLTGKSFELILSVATVEGKLRSFVSKLIKFNEYAREGATSHPILFDITFLMLCSIVQTYGSQVVFEDEENVDKSFIEKWVEDCFIERQKPKCPDSALQHADPTVVDSLLSQLNSSQPDLSSLGVSWDKICLGIPGAMNEVVVAWEQGALSATDVKRILDNMRQTMCCLPVCASAWLCSYMQILHQDALLKPMNMVQQFVSAISSEDGVDNYKERSSLMAQVIRKMQYDIYLATTPKMKGISFSPSISSSKNPMSEELTEVWTTIQEKGWLSVAATNSLESLFNTAGPVWFVSNLVKEIMKLRFNEDLEKSVDLTLAVFHLDIEACTEVLLTEVLPQYLHNNALSSELVEPQSSALAKLCAYCVYAAWQSQSSDKSKNDSLANNDLDDLIPAKLLRLEEGPLSVKAEPRESQYPNLREPLQSALKSVFNAFTVIAEHSFFISHQTYFVFKFLELIVICGGEQARPLLRGMPNTLVRNLVRALPGMFTTDLVLRLYDLTSATGRKATASDLCLLRNMALKPAF